MARNNCPNCGTHFAEGFGRCCSPRCTRAQNRKLNAALTLNSELVAVLEKALALSSLALAEVMRRRRQPGREHEGEAWLALNAELARAMDAFKLGRRPQADK